jgi:hypothetical protein
MANQNTMIAIKPRTPAICLFVILTAEASR